MQGGRGQSPTIMKTRDKSNFPLRTRANKKSPTKKRIWYRWNCYSPTIMKTRGKLIYFLQVTFSFWDRNVCVFSCITLSCCCCCVTEAATALCKTSICWANWVLNLLIRNLFPSSILFLCSVHQKIKEISMFMFFEREMAEKQGQIVKNQIQTKFCEQAGYLWRCIL